MAWFELIEPSHLHIQWSKFDQIWRYWCLVTTELTLCQNFDQFWSNFDLFGPNFDQIWLFWWLVIIELTILTKFHPILTNFDIVWWNGYWLPPFWLFWPISTQFWPISTKFWHILTQFWPNFDQFFPILIICACGYHQFDSWDYFSPILTKFGPNLVIQVFG